MRSYIRLIEFKEMWSDILLIVYIEIWLYTSIEYSFCFHSCLSRCFYDKMMTQKCFFLSYSVSFSFIVCSLKDSNQNVFFSLNDIFFIELLFCFDFHSYYSFILVLNTIGNLLSEEFIIYRIFRQFTLSTWDSGLHLNGKTRNRNEKMTIFLLVW